MGCVPLSGNKDNNTNRHDQLDGFFVRKKGGSVELTNKMGDFWDTSINVVYPGILPYDECEKLFAPLWKADFGE